MLLLLASDCATSATAADRLDPTLTVVLGGGLSAGFSGFHLTEAAQNQAWPVLVAKQMGTYISVPSMRESGQAGVVNSYQPLSGLLPQVTQSGERALPFPFFSMNLSVPFLRVGDALRLRPQPQYDGIKLISAIEGDILKTLVNAILGGPLLTLQPPVLWTQVEYAEILNPTLAFIQLGFEDVAEAAVHNDPGRITPADLFSQDYTQLLERMLNTSATVVMMTVPDPTETAYFVSIDDLARQYGLAGDDLRTRFSLATGDMITLGGMIEIADTLRGRRPNTLSPGSVLSEAVAASVRAAVGKYNAAIRTAAQGKKAEIFDLADFMHQVKSAGARWDGGSVTGAYGGGFYSEDGIYPSSTGQALLANAVLQFLNGKYGSNFAPVAVVEGP
jgi:lysophospholipase L1-like esterase